MGVATWPIDLNHRPLRDSYRWRPHAPQSRTEMEQGVARKRRLWADSPATISGVWPFSLAGYELFRAWHHAALEDGAAWFRMPVWTGASYFETLCKFVGVHEPVLRGLIWSVAFEIEVRQVAFLAPGFSPSVLARQWPAELDETPLRDGYTMVPHRPVVTSDIAQGPVATKRWFEDGPVTPDLIWAMSPSDFELFRAWYHWGLRDGVSWFLMPVWIGGLYSTRRVRFLGMYEAQISGGEWLVKARLEVRDVPYLDDSVVFVAGTVGEAAFVGLADGLHDVVHVQYPAAV